MIETLNNLKTKQFFPLNEWGERGLNPSEPATIEEMQLAVETFIDFLISLHKTHPTNQFAIQEIQKYFDDWDSFDFDTEETEYIFDSYFEILNEIKIEPKEFSV